MLGVHSCTCHDRTCHDPSCTPHRDPSPPGSDPETVRESWVQGAPPGEHDKVVSQPDQQLDSFTPHHASKVRVSADSLSELNCLGRSNHTNFACQNNGLRSIGDFSVTSLLSFPLTLQHVSFQHTSRHFKLTANCSQRLRCPHAPAGLFLAIIQCCNCDFSVPGNTVFVS